MAQAKTAKKRQQPWNELVRTLADDLVPEGPGRREPRAVERRPESLSAAQQAPASISRTWPPILQQMNSLELSAIRD